MFSVPLTEVVGDFQFFRKRYNPGTTTILPIGTVDPSKFCVLLQSGPSSTVWVDFSSSLVVNEGYLVSGTLGYTMFKFKDVGSWMQQQLFAIATGAGALIVVTEIYYRPKG